MKKILSFIIIILIFTSCSDQDDTIPQTQNTSRDLVFLKVDFQTNTFLGGSEYHFDDVEMSDTLPFEENYIPPADFGNYSLKFLPTNTIVFDGPLSWMGGSYNYPVNQEANSYATTTISAPINLTTAEYFTPTANLIAGEGYTNFDYQAIWNAVKNLEITNNYANNNAKVGFLLYTPGLGLFNPESACWFVILYK